ncbi:hypothetical protein CR513_49071, partial [Mucuna pruriens]
MHTLNPFVCGSFHNEYDEACLASPLSSPKKYKRKDSRKNPYSTRGLEKFSELLADLDEKRQKVYSETNPHDISFVRFVYSNTDDIVPVVVKVKKNSNKDQKHKRQELKVVRARTTTFTSELIHTDQEHKIESEGKVAKMNNFPWEIGKPSFYLPVLLIMILWLLITHGRIFTILCICIFWFTIYIIRGPYQAPQTRRSMMIKKSYDRAMSDSRIVMSNEGARRKYYVRQCSEKIGESEGSKKKDYVRVGSDKKINIQGSSSVSPTNSGDPHGSKKNKNVNEGSSSPSPRSGGDSEGSKKNKKKIWRQFSHKKTSISLISELGIEFFFGGVNMCRNVREKQLPFQEE